MRKRPCDYYDVMCSRPESDCMDNCPREEFLFPLRGEARDRLLEAFGCNPFHHDCLLGCEGCPDASECMIEH